MDFLTYPGNQCAGSSSISEGLQVNKPTVAHSNPCLNTGVFEEAGCQNNKTPVPQDGSIAINASVVSPLKLQISYNSSGKKCYKKCRFSVKEPHPGKKTRKQKNVRNLKMDKLLNEKLYCQRCKTYLSSHHNFESHLIAHVHSTSLSVVIPRITILQDIGNIAKEVFVPACESKTLMTDKQPAVSESDIIKHEVIFPRYTESSSHLSTSVESLFDSGQSSFNKSLEKFQTDAIEELNKQIRSLTDVSSNNSCSDDMSSRREEISYPETCNMQSKFVPEMDSVTDCKNVTVEDELSNGAKTPVQSTMLTEFPVSTAPLPMSSGPTNAPAQCTRNTGSLLLSQPTDSSRPPSVIYMESVKVPSIQSVTSLAPGFMQPQISGVHSASPSECNAVTTGKHSCECKCVTCKNVLEGNLLREARVDLPDGFNEYKCPFCARVFQLKASLVRHCRSVNHGFICDMCGAGFLTEDMFNRHQWLHSSRQPAFVTVSRDSCAQNTAVSCSAPGTSRSQTVIMSSMSQPSLDDRCAPPFPKHSVTFSDTVTRVSVNVCTDDDVVVVGMGKRSLQHKSSDQPQIPHPVTTTTAPKTSSIQVTTTTKTATTSTNSRPENDSQLTNKVSSQNMTTVPSISRILNNTEITLTLINNAKRTTKELSSGEVQTSVQATQPATQSVNSHSSVGGQSRNVTAAPQSVNSHSSVGGQSRNVTAAPPVAVNNASVVPHAPQRASVGQPPVWSPSRAKMVSTGVPSPMYTGHSSTTQSMTPSSTYTSNAKQPGVILHPVTKRPVVAMGVSRLQRMPTSRGFQPAPVNQNIPVWHHPVLPPNSMISVPPQRLAEPRQLRPESSNMYANVHRVLNPNSFLTRPVVSAFNQPRCLSVMGDTPYRQFRPAQGVPKTVMPNQVRMPMEFLQDSQSWMPRPTQQPPPPPPPPYFRQPDPNAKCVVPCMNLKCVHCNIYFPSHVALQVHFNQKHSNLFVCQRCTAPFTTLMTLKRHEATCMEKVRCVVCKAVMLRTEIVRHVREVHRLQSGSVVSNQQQSNRQPSFPTSTQYCSTSSSSVVRDAQPVVNVTWVHDSLNSLARMVGSPPAPVPVISNVVSLRDEQSDSVTSDISAGTDPVRNSVADAADLSAKPGCDQMPIVIDDDPCSTGSLLQSAEKCHSEGVAHVCSRSAINCEAASKEVNSPLETGSNHCCQTSVFKNTANAEIHSLQVSEKHTHNDDVLKPELEWSKSREQCAGNNGLERDTNQSDGVVSATTVKLLDQLTDEKQKDTKGMHELCTEMNTCNRFPVASSLDEALIKINGEDKIVDGNLANHSDSTDKVSHDCTSGNEMDMDIANVCGSSSEKLSDSAGGVDSVDTVQSDAPVERNQQPTLTGGDSLDAAAVSDTENVKDSKDKDLMCPICDQIFSTKNLFLGHIKIHQNGSQYNCVICSRTLESKRQLVIHLRNHMRSCSKSASELPHAKRRRQQNSSVFTRDSLNPSSDNQMMVALLDMDRAACCVSMLKKIGVVGLMSIGDFSAHLSKASTGDGREASDDLPVIRLPRKSK